LHHLWTQVRRVKPWYFLLVCLLLAALSVYALRQNNLKMAQLRSTVYAADKDDGNVGGALKALQAYVTMHMNTNLSSGPDGAYPPIQLQYTYERLQQSQAQQQLDESQTNSQLYTAAQVYCQQQDSTDFSGRNRVPCIIQYVQSHGVSNFAIQTIPASLYEFDFVSPRWSPDLAGWSMLAAVVAFLLFLATWATDRWFKQQLD
jgi:preprotein translocase subunit SecF